MEDVIRKFTIMKIDAYCKAVPGMIPSAVCKAAVKDHSLYNRLKDGTGLTLTRIQTLHDWLDESWPAKAEPFRYKLEIVETKTEDA